MSHLPQFYQQSVPLNSQEYADLTISPAPDGYRFSANAQTILLAAAEFYDAGRHYPIIFTVTADNGVLPLALLGLEQGENLYVNDDGSWQVGYIPAYVRRYPFITSDAADQMVVLFDETFSGFKQPGGEPLFIDGRMTVKAEEVVAFLRDYNNQMLQTGALGAMLAQSGLLRQIDAQATLHDGSSYALNGMLVVDEQKLAQLPDSDIVRMFRSGTLALVYAHLLSLRNLSFLLDRKAARSV